MRFAVVLSAFAAIVAATPKGVAPPALTSDAQIEADRLTLEKMDDMLGKQCKYGQFTCFNLQDYISRVMVCGSDSKWKMAAVCGTGGCCYVNKAHTNAWCVC